VPLINIQIKSYERDKHRTREKQKRGSTGLEVR